MSNNKQQTALEWLEENMWEHIEYKPTLEIQRIRKKIQQAKEMEKEQHENTWDDSFLFKDDWEMTFEQYYELTYGGNK